MDNDVDQKIELVDKNIDYFAVNLADNDKALVGTLKEKIRDIIIHSDLESSDEETTILIKALARNQEADTETIIRAKEAGLGLSRWKADNIEAVRVYRAQDLKTKLVEEVKKNNPNLTDDKIRTVRRLADNISRVYHINRGFENQEDAVLEVYKNKNVSIGKVKNAWNDTQGIGGLIRQTPKQFNEIIKEDEKIKEDLQGVEIPYQKVDILASYDRVMSSIKNPEMRQYLESARRFKILDRVSNVQVSNGFASKIGNQTVDSFVQNSMEFLTKNSVSGGMKTASKKLFGDGVKIATKTGINAAKKIGVKAAVSGAKLAVGATGPVGWLVSAVLVVKDFLGNIFQKYNLGITNNKLVDLVIVGTIALLFFYQSGVVAETSSIVPPIESPGVDGGGGANTNWGSYTDNMQPVNTYSKYNPNGLCGADMTKYQLELDAKIEQAGGKRSRFGVAAAAQYLAVDFPFWVPYFWGGGHGDMDSDGGFLEQNGSYTTKWGCPRFQGNKGAGKAYNTWRFNGLDCSGFVTWAYNSAGFRDWSGSREYRWTRGLFKRIAFGGSNCGLIKSLVKPGDVLKTDTPSSHTAIVLGSDGNRIKFAQEGGSGKGLNVDFINICSGKGKTSFQFFVTMDNYFNTLGKQ